MFFTSRGSARFNWHSCRVASLKVPAIIWLSMTWRRRYLTQSNFLSTTSLTWSLALHLLSCFNQEKPLRWKEIHTRTQAHHTHTHTHTHTHIHTHAFGSLLTHYLIIEWNISTVPLWSFFKVFQQHTFHFKSAVLVSKALSYWKFISKLTSSRKFSSISGSTACTEVLSVYLSRFNVEHPWCVCRGIVNKNLVTKENSRLLLYHSYQKENEGRAGINFSLVLKILFPNLFLIIGGIFLSWSSLWQSKILWVFRLEFGGKNYHLTQLWGHCVVVWKI